MIKTDDFLSPESRTLKQLKELAIPTALFGLTEVLKNHQNLMKAFENPVSEMVKRISSSTAILGLTEALRQHQDFAKAFAVPTFEMPPSLSQVIKHQMALTESFGAMKKRVQPADLTMINMLKAIELSTHLSSFIIPKPFIDNLRDIGKWEPEEIPDENEIISELGALAVESNGNTEETLDKVQTVLNTLRDEITKLITSTTNAAEKAKLLITYDRVVNHLAIVLSILMYFVQAADQTETEERVNSIDAGVNRLEQRPMDDNQVLQERVCDMQADLQAMMTMVAKPDLRVCLKQTSLKNSPNNAAATIGTVELFQLINAVTLPDEQKKKKWIYVTYFDNITGEPKAGWVLQKYFKKNRLLLH